MPTMRLESGFAVGVAAAVALVLAAAPTASASHSEKSASGQRLHWARSGTALTQVYWIDYTGARWPVGRSVTKWNESSRVKSYYKTSWTSSCSSDKENCVRVDDYDVADGNYGYAELDWDADGHFIEGRVKVMLNNRYKLSAADDRHTVCQELGHALGLDHQYATTCMNDRASEMMYPNSHDYTQLASVYNH